MTDNTGNGNGNGLGGAADVDAGVAIVEANDEYMKDVAAEKARTATAPGAAATAPGAPAAIVDTGIPAGDTQLIEDIALYRKIMGDHFKGEAWTQEDTDTYNEHFRNLPADKRVEAAFAMKLALDKEAKGEGVQAQPEMNEDRATFLETAETEYGREGTKEMLEFLKDNLTQSQKNRINSMEPEAAVVVARSLYETIRDTQKQYGVKKETTKLGKDSGQQIRPSYNKAQLDEERLANYKKLNDRNIYGEDRQRLLNRNLEIDKLMSGNGLSGIGQGVKQETKTNGNGFSMTLGNY
jgi:hypothetical protein